MATANCAAMHAQLTNDPRQAINPSRHHRLRGDLSTGKHGGRDLEQWRFLIDDAQHKVWLTVVESGHPSKTDK